jgi:prophage DNA circulation protein
MSLQIDNKQAALAYRDELLALFDALSETASDDVFNAVQSVSAAVVTDVNNRLAQLPSLDVLTTPETVPAVVLAYDVYGDIEKESDLITRNKVRHPGFVGGEVSFLR